MKRMTKLMHLYGLLDAIATAKTHMSNLGKDGELGSLAPSEPKLQEILKSLQDLVTTEILILVDPTTERERHINRIFEEALKRGTGKIE